MNIELNDDQTAFQQHFRKFAREKLAPIAQKAEEERKYPLEVFKLIADLGYLGLPFDEKYGGAQMDHMALAIMFEEFGAVSAGLALGIYCHMVLALTPVAIYGTEEQKQEYLVPGIKGEKLGAWGITEPSAGSDLTAIQTKAQLKGDHYWINGSKLFTTNGTFADFVIITAYTDSSKGPKGISLFIMDKGTPGFKVSKRLKTMGVRCSETTELSFEDCKIPKSKLLGEENLGFYNALKSLTGGRVVAAAFSIGLARAAFEQALGYTRERKQFNMPIYENQGIGWSFADMATSIDAARLLTYRAATLADNKKPHIKEASMAKLFATEACSKITSQALQLHGGYGFTEEYPAERYYRDCKLMEIGEGTNQIHRNMIAKFL